MASATRHPAASPRAPPATGRHARATQATRTARIPGVRVYLTLQITDGGQPWLTKLGFPSPSARFTRGRPACRARTAGAAPCGCAS